MKEIITVQRNATQMVQRELDQVKDENKQLKCDLSDQHNRHQEERLKLLKQTKYIIEVHKAERRHVQEVQSQLDCVTKEKRDLIQETERLHSQLKSQGITIENLDELRDKLHDQTQQGLMEKQVNQRDQLVQELKDQLHRSEGERYLLESRTVRKNKN
ncbi:hypothetical protein WMY93_011976 [Mugilogobius chulae]|uniref:Uncharacterized protein n=1 Tax=Mugilogobius chulae TaxID=88201 RepID=A0AAW0P5F7_9GOBI